MSFSRTDKTIVLDLDATLIHTFGPEHFGVLGDIAADAKPHLKTRVYINDYVEDTARHKTWGVTRPYLFEFLEFCFSRFKNVVVWSAGSHRYVHNICEIIFRPHRRKPTMILTSRDCQGGVAAPAEKPLVWLYEKLPGATELNTIMVDDYQLAVSKNLENAILIPQFSPGNVSDVTLAEYYIMNDTDVSLLALIKYFSTSQVEESADVRSLAMNPFNL